MLKETGEALCTRAWVERQEGLLSQRGRNVDRSRDLPEDVAFEQSHTAVAFTPW